MSEVPEIRSPTSKGGYCHHCARRNCIWPTCQDIANAHAQGFSDEQIVEAVKERNESR